MLNTLWCRNQSPYLSLSFYFSVTKKFIFVLDSIDYRQIQRLHLSAFLVWFIFYFTQIMMFIPGTNSIHFIIIQRNEKVTGI